MSMIINPDEKIKKDPYNLYYKGLSILPEIQEIGHGGRYGYGSVNPGLVGPISEFVGDKSKGYNPNISDYLKGASPRISYFHPSGAGASLGFNTQSRLPGIDFINSFGEGVYIPKPNNEVELGINLSERLIMDMLKKIKSYVK